MDLAIGQLRYPYCNLFRAFTGVLLDGGQLFADALVVDHLFQQRLGGISVLVQPPYDLLLDRGDDPGPHLG